MASGWKRLKRFVEDSRRLPFVPHLSEHEHEGYERAVDRELRRQDARALHAVATALILGNTPSAIACFASADDPEASRLGVIVTLGASFGVWCAFLRSPSLFVQRRRAFGVMLACFGTMACLFTLWLAALVRGGQGCVDYMMQVGLYPCQSKKVVDGRLGLVGVEGVPWAVITGVLSTNFMAAFARAIPYKVHIRIVLTQSAIFSGACALANDWSVYFQAWCSSSRR